MNNKILKIMLDIVMTILFVTLIFAHETGLVFHEIAGLSIFALFASHVLLNWSWVKNVTKNLFSGKLKTSSKLRYALNVTMFLTIATITITGILVSQVVFPSLGSSLGSKLLVLVHKWTSYLGLGLFGLHIILHGHYLVESVRKILANLRESNVKKTFVRLGAIAVIVFILYSRVISIATNNVNIQTTQYATQIASSSQTTTTFTGRENSTDIQVYAETTTNVGDTMSLTDYLGDMHCTACHKNCSLLSPQCGKADRQIKAAKITYQELYSNTSS
ncbi:DUF4405 domain-containing protein [Desulfosporosinus fructosivorans]|uniref:DUF4405 domain-containing protein n=1 Tax=Desulfosporosinus fructosivorans TaxID=2018669 RepID=A0A4Z0R308_9FIRM|nr:DUF4405 domain-containing protein [Desulfosporosinus fructosivorans]TGE36026.1 DUF4405 domain-containing protein [Desulfosporosinus fructosivorans]